MVDHDFDVQDSHPLLNYVVSILSPYSLKYFQWDGSGWDGIVVFHENCHLDFDKITHEIIDLEVKIPQGVYQQPQNGLFNRRSRCSA